MKDQTAAAIRLLEAELGPVIVDGAGDHPQLCIQCGAITYDVNREGHAQHRNGCPPARRRRAVQ
jgi:hypothetical protein